ncbi:hypothetical protein PSN45_002315 [Yamadazyma tenuis]|uniref:DUF866-domain-containing protein n=1 Tax=Candida tenuis (strain ATCC 10573 / BCRC 21748 / CBS 615 / JCM 9827 / NBRC 10315 / NRRL Y-1498 / VKM Y-70) TaxID=590646 RepID=G3BEX7_CANTC|nr:uncharacterized protein CANTEDRAFT_115986 [Yamadazyma tenuis ATCC 10573]XP_006690176.1 uncharacterized protein CANTEDRAFT_115986 [Yamadazyma tenuis ATCC 10573]EGV60961.1 hypothetical protein CANTEDRAFT_115986 [Yamadazyma tenuis ATCC 10573]EGV60962.1 hypothetical protein CANTEDRAFT_115986 [Yamadazyma tenuis ATCC 10573]WEJ94815.1 hypothetical protein PSN45_002315 [Yamadazyma tenuis]
MVKFALKITAELAGVTGLHPQDTPESPFEYTFTIECTKCREVHAKPVTINRFETHEISGSRGEASFVFRCKSCKSEHSAAIEPTGTVCTPDTNGKPVTILTIDARGLDFNEFIPDGFFACEGEDSPTKFTEIDLSEGEWYDYDDNAGEEVSVTEISWSIVRL